jgi:hypothetical protein
MVGSGRGQRVSHARLSKARLGYKVLTCAAFVTWITKAATTIGSTVTMSKRRGAITGTLLLLAGRPFPARVAETYPETFFTDAVGAAVSGAVLDRVTGYETAKDPTDIRVPVDVQARGVA